MKVLFLANANSAHTYKWVNGLLNKGIEVLLFSLSKPTKFSYNVEIQTLGLEEKVVKDSEGSPKKLKYIFSLPKIIKLTKNVDIVHCHYASSYGLLGKISKAFSKNFKLFISVWGSDVFSFPKKSFLHNILIRWVFSSADCITSTSFTMAKETQKYTPKKIEVIPFGVDTKIFRPSEKDRKIMEKYGIKENDLVVGTVRNLEPKYGIEYLIKAFKILITKNVEAKLVIVGEGSSKTKLLNLVKNLNLEDKVVFTGFIDNQDLWKIYNIFDVFVMPSVEESESFGVSLVEAMACSKACIATKVGGLPEVLENYGILVEKQNENQLAEAIEKLLLNPQLRLELGQKAREKALREYDFNKNLDSLIKLYKNCVGK